MTDRPTEGSDETSETTTPTPADPLWGDAAGGAKDRHTVDARVDAQPIDPDSVWTTSTEDSGRDPAGRLTISTSPDSVGPSYDSARQARLMSNSPRQWPRVLAGLLMLAVGAAVAYFVLDLDAFSEADDDAGSTPSATAQPTSDAVEEPVPESPPFAELSDGPPAVVTARRTGVLTAVGEIGEPVGRGDTLAVIDGEPTMALYGTAPFERPLEPEVAGDDVAQLQANLLALGVVAQENLSATGEYDDATVAAVEAWQQSLGLGPTGVVAQGAVLAIDGPGVLDGALPAGTDVVAGDPLGSVAMSSAHRDLVQSGSGIASAMLTAGTPIAHGDVVMFLGDTPVVAVTNGSPVDAGVIEAMATGDNLQLEQVLKFFGFDPDDAMVVDDEGDLATIAAVNRWRVASGFGEAFAIGPQYYFEMPRDSVVDTTYVPDGTPIEPGTLVYTVSSSRARIVSRVPVDDASAYAVGDTLTLETEDGTAIDAVVETISESSVAAEDGSGTDVVEMVLDPIGDTSALEDGPVFLPDEAG